MFSSSRKPAESASASPGRQNSRRLWPALLLPLLLITIAFAILGGIIFTAVLTDMAGQASRRGLPLDNMLKLGVSETLALVSLLQGLLALTGTIVLSRTLSYIQWGLSARPEGLPYLDFLALSPMTMGWGLVLLFTSSHSLLSTRLWSGLRFVLFTLLWLSGVILLFRTSLLTACDTVHSYKVTAGIGPFNASYVEPFLSLLNATGSGTEPSVLPYTYYGWVNNIVTNPTLATVVDENNSGPSRISYLLSGGVWGASPWIPTGYDNGSFVRIDNVPSMQLDFTGKHGSKTFKEDQCELLGSENNTFIAAELCLATTGKGGIRAGLFVCTDGIQEGKCAQVWPFAPNLTTTVHFSRRTATLLASKSNYTISNPSDLSAPIPVPVSSSDLAAYRTVLRWLLDYPAASMPASSSLLEGFWSASAFMADPVMDNLYLQSLHSLLAFPVYAFNANNYGNLDLYAALADSPSAERPPGLLPAEFYTKAGIVRPLLKIRFDPAVLAAFAACHAVVLVFAAAGLAWAAIRPAGTTTATATTTNTTLPAVSSFPAFDSYFKPEVVVFGGGAAATTTAADAEDQDQDHGHGDDGRRRRRRLIVVDPRGVDAWTAQDAEILGLVSGAVVRKKGGWPILPRTGWEEVDYRNKPHQHGYD